MAQEIHYIIRFESDYGPRFETLSHSEEIEKFEYEKLLFCSRQEQINFIRNKFKSIPNDVDIINIQLEKQDDDEYINGLLDNLLKNI